MSSSLLTPGLVLVVTHSLDRLCHLLGKLRYPLSAYGWRQAILGASVPWRQVDTVSIRGGSVLAAGTRKKSE